MSPVREETLAVETSNSVDVKPASTGGRLRIPLDVDLQALRRAVESVLETPVNDVKYVDQGLYHKVYEITFNGRPAIIARVARNTCPRDKMASEAATINYVRSHTSIPIPQVLHVCNEVKNPVGGEYMLQNKASGVKLASVFESMTTDQRASLVKNLTPMLYQLYQLRFERIGSLYEDDFHKCFVGPIINSRFFRDGRWLLKNDKGAFDSIEAFLLACLQRERVAYADQIDAALRLPEWKNDPTICLIPEQIMYMERIVRETFTHESSTYALCAEDINLGNIFVDDNDPSCITSLIDWECVMAYPLWAAAGRPPWCIPPAEDRKELYVGQREELTSLSDAMLLEARALDPEYARLMEYNLDKDEYRRRMLFHAIADYRWEMAWLTKGEFSRLGYTDGWPEVSPGAYYSQEVTIDRGDGVMETYSRGDPATSKSKFRRALRRAK